MADQLQTYHASCDLGSNSFHLLIVRQDSIGGKIHVVDRLKEMVRLGGGINQRGELDKDTARRALECLRRFGQRLRDIPASQVRVVGTQGLRRLRKPADFIHRIEAVINFPVEIIAGREEARMIFLGVTSFMSQAQPIRRLVVDIGGGSTELIVGTEDQAQILESLPFGCVSLTDEFFADGKISPSRWQAASNHFRSALRRYKNSFKEIGWEESVGCSGTIRAIHEVCLQQGWTEKGITRKALSELRHYLLGCGQIDQLNLAGLSQRRLPVFIGGVILLEALFKDLELRNMQVSPWALREGVLLDMIGRYSLDDPRQQTIDQFCSRYSVDTRQADRVHDVASYLYEQVAENGKLRKSELSLLGWACQIHEIGLAVSHQNYQKHSAYLVENSDMPGFSQRDQRLLACLLGWQRESIITDGVVITRRRWPQLCLLVALLRLSLILCRSRSDASIPELSLEYAATELRLGLGENWQATHSLTVHDLNNEQHQLEKLGIRLCIETIPEFDRVNGIRGHDK